MPRSKGPSYPCKTCREPQFKGNLRDGVCNACRMEKGTHSRFWGGHTDRKTGNWADAHEKRY